MEPPFDKAKAVQQIGGDEAFWIEVVETFLEEWPVLQEEIERAIGTADATTLRRAAHTLKGSADILSAAPTRAAAMALESLARDGAWDKVPEAASALEEEIERLLPALRGLIASSDRPG